MIDPREVGSAPHSGYRFDGQWFGYVVNGRTWSPGDPVSACLDPVDALRHVVSITEPCGEERAGARRSATGSDAGRS